MFVAILSDERRKSLYRALPHSMSRMINRVHLLPSTSSVRAIVQTERLLDFAARSHFGPAFTMGLEFVSTIKEYEPL